MNRPDGDHIPNGLEARFGTHPGEFTADGSTITTEHPQNEIPPGDLTDYCGWPPDLTDWYASGSGPGGGVTVTFSPSTTATITTVTATVSGAPDRIFLRAGVSQD